METEDQNIRLVRRYLTTQMSEVERELFETALQTDADLQAIYEFEKALLQTIQQIDAEQEEQFQQKYGKILDNLKDIPLEEHQWQDALQKAEDELERKLILPDSYGEEVLKALFAPEQNFERAIQQTLRSTNKNVKKIDVLIPENEVNVEQILEIELAYPIETPLQLSVFNNRETLIVQQVIPSHTTSYEVKLKGFAPGRYYWQLRASVQSSDYNTVVRVFYIKKELNPDK